MKLLIDADSAIYKAGCANEERSYLIIEAETGGVAGEEKYKRDAVALVEEKAKRGGEWIIEKHKKAGPLAHALSNAKIVCGNMTTLAHKERQMFISGEGNFRYDIYADYKGKRDPADRPLQEEDIRQYLIKHWGAETVDAEEADDRVSYLQCQAEPKSTCIVSIDKDLLNTPGYNFNYDKQELKWISEEEADLNFARQLLMGDSTDNIPGLRGVGPKKALSLLPEWRVDWELVVAEEYRRVHGEEWKEMMNMNGQLLWMRREPEQIWQTNISEGGE